jgi:hypothetical protein
MPPILSSPRTQIIAILTATTLALSPLLAQNTPTGANDNTQDKDDHLPKDPKVLFWRLSLPAGKVTLDLTKVTTVAQHEYISDELFRVTELNIATTSDLLIRFYYLEKYIPLKGASGQVIKGAADHIQQKAETAADTAGIEPVWRQVHKNYPATTHARTVEYRLQSKDHLTKIRKHVEAAWIAQKSGIYEISIPETQN